MGALGGTSTRADIEVSEFAKNCGRVTSMPTSDINTRVSH